MTLAIRRGTARKDVGGAAGAGEIGVQRRDDPRQAGLNLEELTPQLAARYGVEPSDAFLITGVEEDSPAAAAGLQRGILVTA